MINLNPHKTGLVVGATLGLWHLVWSILVAAGLAQMLLDFVLQLHMIHLTLQVGPFDLVTAVGLVVVTSAIGYLVGFVLASIWNYVHQK
jgi:hypothetical protein